MPTEITEEHKIKLEIWKTLYEMRPSEGLWSRWEKVQEEYCKLIEND